MAIPVKKPFSVRLSAFLFEGEEIKNFQTLLGVPIGEVDALKIEENFDLDGMIFVKRKPDDPKRPPWAGYLDRLHGAEVGGLETASSSAVLFLRIEKAVIAFAFGYGRYLLDDEKIVSDFGIRTALNTLDHNTLRSVDLFSLEQEPIQKRSQALKSANINNFGVDVGRDVLKAVTGDPRAGIPWSAISGGGAQYAFSAKIEGYHELKQLAEKLATSYAMKEYQEHFAWVDNIQRVRNSAKQEVLNGLLVEHVMKGDTDKVKIAVPDIADWKEIYGFSFTNSKNDIKAFPDMSDYYAANDLLKTSLEKLKSHTLFCHVLVGGELEYSLYESIYFECEYEGRLHILFHKEWFTVDQDYVRRVDAMVAEVPLFGEKFPHVKIVPKKRKKKSKGKEVKDEEEIADGLEAEGDYNQRIANLKGYHLLDKKLVKSDGAASSIEVCDLLSDDRKFIHAKHRKGNSSGLSHLFAQGRVSAELLLSDQSFRKGARKELPVASRKLIPEAKFLPEDCEIVFLVLGAKTDMVREELPFFSKVNLSSAFRNLTERKFNVSICGAEIEDNTLDVAI